ncbi:2-amino-4-hydroxy-6-hydroxymethyldihydropteridine diphosphokinase [Vibrio profundum]|uniref:2-amino-4-hydroxy-6- hydroxymethyldihydropteridine diphosphokinase n=1 Tax=Vibrio profundum TaxID=2910247 RepID=UPI003D13F171
MITAYIGVGSNIDRCKHSEVAVKELSKLGSNVRASTIYESDPIGFFGDSFYNFVVEIQTDLPLQTFAEQLKHIECDWGRPQNSAKFQDRTLDLDLILFGEQVSQHSPQLPRDDIYKYPFVIQPLYELCPERVIPADGRNIRQIWQQANNLSVLKPIETWFEL